MQQLVFESAWDKTIARADREAIIELFQKTKDNTSDQIVLHSINQARNYRNDLLAIVLIHNFSNEIFSFENLHVSYSEKNQKISTKYFSFPKLKLDPKTSMPWTFIFPESFLTDTPTFIDGQVHINSN